ncbi:MAG: putative signaling protein [Massilibacillus sp.]|nr:putative signaling protein [Massilibacillus sp.]
MKNFKQFDVESYRILAELSEAITFEWDVQTDKFYVSSQWKLKFDYEPSYDHFSQNIRQALRIHPADRRKIVRYVNQVKKNIEGFLQLNNYAEFEVRLLHNKQEYIWCKFRLVLRCGDDNQPERVFGMITDIDAEKKEHQKLLCQAQKDVLTGLYNKATTNQLIEEYIAEVTMPNKKQALFIIDIDGFKDVNDHLGHLFGDAVIADLAHSISRTFRDSDIVGRIGGDEFIVLLKNIPKMDIVFLKVQELLKSLRRSYDSNDKTYEVSASIGIALYPDHGDTFDTLFQNADQALYYVKEHGKNNFYLYYEEMPQVQYENKRMTASTDESNVPISKSFHENVIEYIFKILYRSKDANTAIHLILEVIGLKYNVSRAVIHEKTEDSLYSNTFEWCNKSVPSIQAEQQGISADFVEKVHPYFDKNGVFSCANINLLSDELKLYFKDSPVKSLLYCHMIDSGMVRGVIGFEYYKHPRIWTNAEIEVLSFTAEILSTFLLKKRAIDKLKLSHVHALEIMDHIDSFIYVIDKNTHEVLFLNKKAIEFFGSHHMGGLCYEFISCEDGPCSYCPMLQITESIEQVNKEVYLPKRKLWIKAAVSKIHWNDDREVCLLHCHDITEYKN